ncbi:uncharacterized protein KGF55_003303 [Candida pseudojiufengensis]|uniref:uncharacterized protein n=1 Tax=Candida pseudojiufengensis TaxID=497109 RepID=UPI002225800F|nr:uncharacterized protein KGF55_003303 [Candida pseudojiufengensis]KAI5962227.1 hypothetical protein KGF55_003303 [Candida pseudojiufengensis]
MKNDRLTNDQNSSIPMDLNNVANSQSSPNFVESTVIHHSPKSKSQLNSSRKEKKAWYHKGVTSSDYEEDSENSEDHNSSHNKITWRPESLDFESMEKTPSPKKTLDLNHQNFLSYASTPLNHAISFLSPMNKLNNLHLESEIIDDKQDDYLRDNEESDDGKNVIFEEYNKNDSGDENDEEEEEDDDDDDEYSLGNKTIANNSDDDNSDNAFQISPPKYISKKRRMNQDTDIRMSTPNTISHESKMSICNTNISSTNDSSLKLSFSTNDSTPCPPQPKRKKLKFKQTSTTNILDLNYARKTSLQDMPPIPIHHDQPEEEDDENEEKQYSSSFNKINNELSSTPISQSTPSSSRASTPPLPSTHPANETSSLNSINGYKFVKPKQRLPSNYRYETPINGNKFESFNSGNNNNNNAKYNQLRDSYNKQDYHIIGEIPITSAGLMNEEDEDIHIGDKRINDPYITPELDINDNENEVIKFEYYNKLKLPLISPYFFYEIVETNKLLEIINQTNLEKFYKIILNNSNQSMLELLKQERIKWHPDKWIGRLKNEKYVTIEVIDQLSQIINSMIDSLEE